jgi:hypothetical protein
MFPYSSLLVAVRNHGGKPFFRLSGVCSGMGNNCEGGDGRSRRTTNSAHFWLVGKHLPSKKFTRAPIPKLTGAFQNRLSAYAAAV